MKFDFIRFCEDYGIPYRKPGEHHHVTPGWIGVDCPFCQTTGKFHMAFHVDGGAMNCWRCGAHSLPEYLEALFPDEYREILRRYKRLVIYDKAPVNEKKERPNWPYGTTELLAPHRNYLKKRGFNPDEISILFKVKGTTGLALPQWRWRLIIPVFYKGELVAIQGRDITGKKTAKYRSAGNIKDYLYNEDNVVGDSVIVTEGVMDVWRLGIDKAVATMGTTITDEQFKKLLRYNLIYIILDGDEAGRQASRELAARLKAFGKKAVSVRIKGDPADLTEEQVNKLLTKIKGIQL